MKNISGAAEGKLGFSLLKRWLQNHLKVCVCVCFEADPLYLVVNHYGVSSKMIGKFIISHIKMSKMCAGEGSLA